MKNHLEVTDRIIRARFLREARVLSSIEHEGVVRVYELMEHEGLPAMLLELAEGGSLEGRRLTSDEAVSVLRQLLGALVHLHARGVIHRDIRPSHVLFGGDGSVKLPQLITGDVRLYSRTEQKSGVRPPVRIAENVAAESVEPLIRVREGTVVPEASMVAVRRLSSSPHDASGLFNAVAHLETTNRYLATVDLQAAYAELERSGLDAEPDAEANKRVCRVFDAYSRAEERAARIRNIIVDTCRVLERITASGRSHVASLCMMRYAGSSQSVRM